MRPNLVIVGAMKSGTMSLYAYLRAHPDIYMSKKKELNFFRRDELWERGPEWYESWFDDERARTAVARGEASPSYTEFADTPTVAERMHRIVPDAKLVYLVRHPVDRIESHFQHTLRKGLTRRPIDEEVLSDPRYLITSSYATRIAPFIELFGRDRLLVVISEALRDDREATLRTVLGFVGADSTHMPDNISEMHSQAALKRVPRNTLARVRRTRIVSNLAQRIPDKRRRLLSGVVTTASNAPEHRLSDKTRAELADRLHDEVGRFRSLLPPGFDGWDIG